jgi:hypothetical protein
MHFESDTQLHQKNFLKSFFEMATEPRNTRLSGPVGRAIGANTRITPESDS